jgi:hypothetical protein
MDENHFDNYAELMEERSTAYAKNSGHSKDLGDEAIMEG